MGDSSPALSFLEISLLRKLTSAQHYTSGVIQIKDKSASLNSFVPENAPGFPLPSVTSSWGLWKFKAKTPNKPHPLKCEGKFVVEGISVPRNISKYKQTYCAAVRITQSSSDLLKVGEFRCISFERRDTFSLKDRDIPLVVQPHDAPLVPSETLCSDVVSGLRDFIQQTAIVCTPAGLFTLTRKDGQADHKSSRQLIENGITGIQTVLKVGEGGQLARLASNVIVAVTRKQSDSRSISTILDLARQNLGLTVPIDPPPVLPSNDAVHPSLFTIGRFVPSADVEEALRKALGPDYVVSAEEEPLVGWQKRSFGLHFKVQVTSLTEPATKSASINLALPHAQVHVEVTWPSQLTTTPREEIVDAIRAATSPLVQGVSTRMSSDDFSVLNTSLGKACEDALVPFFSNEVSVTTKGKQSYSSSVDVPRYASDPTSPRIRALVALCDAACLHLKLFPWPDSRGITLGEFP